MTRGRAGTVLGAVLFSIVGVFASGTAWAQSVPSVEIVGTDMSQFPVVRLEVAVSGEAASAPLTPDSITVTENGEELAAEVTALSDETIDVVLAIDVSGSMAGEPIAQAKVAALEFLDELPPSARAAIVSFGNSADLRSGFTTDRAASRQAVDALSDGGETALYDGVTLAVQQVDASEASRSAVVVLSDGGDTVSSTDLEATVALLEQTETDFFAVSLQSGEANEAALSRMAEAAGGRVVPATDPAALSAAYVDLGQRIANQYEVTFESVTGDPTGEFSVTVGPTGDSDSVEVALPDRGAAGGPTTTESAGSARAPERLVTTAEAHPLEEGWVLWVGAGLVAVALAITAVAVAPSGDRPRRRSLGSDRVVDEHTGTGERIVDSVRGAATRVASRAVERAERGNSIDDALDRAGIIMRAGEFVAVVVGVAIVAALLLGLLMGPVGVALGVFVPTLGAPAFLRFMAKRRNRKFGDQLSDTLMLMSGSLRSGFGVAQAVDSVAQEMDAPIGVEFQRAILEMRLGRDIESALEGIAHRMDNEDFGWVVDAMRIHRQVGGDLAQILDQVSETIRARNRLRRQIAALTAEGRMSGIVLGALPVVMALVLWTSNEEYLKPLFTRTGGQIMLAFGIGLLVTGALWLKKLVDVEL